MLDLATKDAINFAVSLVFVWGLLLVLGGFVFTAVQRILQWHRRRTLNRWRHPVEISNPEEVKRNYFGADGRIVDRREDYEQRRNAYEYSDSFNPVVRK